MAFVLPLAMAAISSIGSAATAAGGALGLGEAAAGATGAAATAASAVVPSWFGTAGLATSALGGVVGAVGQYEQGQAAATSAKFNADIERQNAAISRENAAIAGQSGAQQAFNSGQKSRQEMGAIIANQAASGIDVNSGSALDTRLSADDLGMMDALTIRSNATREAYGYRTQAISHDEQAVLDRASATNDLTASYLNAGSTLLGAAGNAASRFYGYKMEGGLGSTS